MWTQLWTQEIWYSYIQKVLTVRGKSWEGCGKISSWSD